MRNVLHRGARLLIERGIEPIRGLHLRMHREQRRATDFNGGVPDHVHAAAVFAVGFVMRPIGAWIMGIYADRKGRKAGLTLSVTLMCAGSLIIA